MEKIFAGIEAGGTKFVLALGRGPDNILAETRIPTSGPAETLASCLDFFNQGKKNFGKIAAMGIGSFGPLDPNPASSNYGYITSTPKPGWRNTDMAGYFKTMLNIPIAFDTDVNAAALGEGRWGAAKGLSDYVYITVGTGIGGGVVVNGNLVHGLVHPEIGHLRIPRDKNKDAFPGICPYHGDCLEGLASGPSMEKRWGRPSRELPEKHRAWDIESDYISEAALACILLYSPKRIILGGGIMREKLLFPLIRKKVKEKLNGYICHKNVQEDIDGYITAPDLGDKAGICGAFILAEKAQVNG